MSLVRGPAPVDETAMAVEVSAVGIGTEADGVAGWRMRGGRGGGPGGGLVAGRKAAEDSDSCGDCPSAAPKTGADRQTSQADPPSAQTAQTAGSSG